MKLQVTETTQNVLTQKEFSAISNFSFTDGETMGKLNYGTIFNAEINDSDKSVKVSLIRQVNENDFEVYDSAILHPAQNNIIFMDKSNDINLKLAFKLIK